MSSFEPEDDHEDLIPPVYDAKDDMVRVSKGAEINISRLDPAMREITLGVGWDLKKFEGDPIDVDASVFLLNHHDQTVEDEDFVFYNNRAARNAAVRHLGDSRTGAGDGDDEQVIVDTYALPFDIVKIAVVLSIYEMETKSADFTMVKNVYFRVVNNETKHETFRFELDDDLGDATALHIGNLERIGADWIFVALGKPVKGGLQRMATDFGILVAEIIGT